MPEFQQKHQLTRHDAFIAIALAALSILLRVGFIPPEDLGFDGPRYVNALKLDSTFWVPPPGNIGYVLLGKVVVTLGVEPALAFSIVSLAIGAIAAVFVYLLAASLFPRALAAVTALAVISTVSASYHSVVIQSYIAWLAVLPAVAFFGVRFVRSRSWADCAWGATALGLGTIVRPDLVLFGGPLLASFLLIGRARVAQWTMAGAIGAACCCFWFFYTASILGGPTKYLQLIREQNEFINTFGLQGRGVVEGLLRNTVKYAQFFLWAVHLAVIPAAVGAWRIARDVRSKWRVALVAACWVGPSLYFSILMFMGNAGLILPVLPVMFLAAAHGLSKVVPRRAVMVMGVLAAVNIAQFTLTPLPRMTDQRRAILMHMFFGYCGPALRRGYNLELDDFGIDRSLRNTARQMLHPAPVPKIPERLPVDLRPDAQD